MDVRKFVVSCLCAGAGLASAGVQAETKNISDFMISSYGVTYKPDDATAARWSCPSDRLDKPSDKSNRGWVCELPDARLKRTIYWAKNEKILGAVEFGNITGMAGGPDAPFGLIDCTQSAFTPAGAKAPGVLRDCRIPLPNGDFYVSFFHVNQRGLVLTFLVKNSSRQGSTPDVAKDLRSWLSELSFVD